MTHFMHILADGRQEEFFRSMNRELTQPVDGNKLLAVLVALVGFILLMIVLSARKKPAKAARPRMVRHQGKLLKEISKSVGIRSRDLKKLKAIAQQQSVSPLTLLLCPSVLPKANKGRKASPKQSRAL